MSVSTFAALVPFIDYLRPTKSPYLLMIIFGVVALVKTAEAFFSKDEWLMMLLPQFIALIVFTAFSYYGREIKDENLDINDQLKFSRAIAIATAVMCLSFGASHLTGTGFLFNVVYSTCLIQLVIFLVYTTARLFKEETSLEFNFFQFSVITSGFLVGATYCVVQLDISDTSYLYNDVIKYNDVGIDDDTKITKTSHLDLYFFVSIFLYSLWAFCIQFWAKRVLSIVQVKVVDDA